MAPHLDDHDLLELLSPAPDTIRFDIATATALLRIAEEERRAVERKLPFRPSDTQQVVRWVQSRGGTVLMRLERGKRVLDLSTKTGLPHLAAQPGIIGQVGKILLDEWSEPNRVVMALRSLTAHCSDRGVDTLAPQCRLAVTGRLALSGAPIHSISSRIPVPESIGRPRALKSYRQLLRPADGRSVVSADWRSAEVRVAAALSGDPVMIAVIASGGDVLADVARKVGVERNSAKDVVYGLLYGMGDAALAVRLGVPLPEARRVKSAILGQWPVLADWMARTCRNAAATGIVTTAAGREIPTVSGGERSEGKTPQDLAYRAVNYAVQGTGADLLALACSRLADLGVSPLLTWHDEIFVAAAHREVCSTADLLREAMTVPPPWLPTLALDIDAVWGDRLGDDRPLPVIAQRRDGIVLR